MNAHTRAPRVLASCVLLLSLLSPADPGTAAPIPSLGQAMEFVVLGLNNGSITINSAITLIGNVGYSNGVTSTTNQKVDTFIGAVYVHQGATFSYTPATFAPSGGFHYGSIDPNVNSKLDQAYLDANTASSAFAALAVTQSLGVLGKGDSRVVTSTGAVNVISITSLDYKSDTLELVGRSGHDDYFVFNVYGDFTFSQSEVKLTDVSVDHVFFNFPVSAMISDVAINKAESKFYGIILAPHSRVEYHNPATFVGAIIAEDINLHSDFNLVYIPEPTVLVPLGVAMLAALRRRRG